MPGSAPLQEYSPDEKVMMKNDPAPFDGILQSAARAHAVQDELSVCEYTSAHPAPADCPQNFTHDPLPWFITGAVIGFLTGLAVTR
jgi:hypothetical protein